MLLNLTSFSADPIHSQIVSQILDRIIDAEMKPGDEILPVGKLSRQQHIGKSTIAKAYRELERMGVIRCLKAERFVINHLSKDQLYRFTQQKKMNGISQFEKEKIDAELDAAKQIQKGMLPDKLPDNDSISVAAYSTISNDVGGDFYDFFKIEENKYGILIGDASGKGLPAAMLISQIQAIIKSDISHRRSIKNTLILLNTYLKIHSAPKNFATLFFGIFDLRSGLINYSNAGHNFPMIIKHHGGVEYLKTTGPALGIMLDSIYDENVTKLEENDYLFLFTDGLPETIDTEGKQFTEERIEKYCLANKEKNAEEIIDELKIELLRFKSKKNENDDTTFMLLKRNRTLISAD